MGRSACWSNGDGRGGFSFKSRVLIALRPPAPHYRLSQDKTVAQCAAGSSAVSGALRHWCPDLWFCPYRRCAVLTARFNIPIPKPSLTPLSTLLATLSSQTDIPISQLKLIHKGAVLKDPSLTISSYGIADNATLVLVGKEGEIPTAPPQSTKSNPQNAATGKRKQPETDTESVLVDWIKSVVKSTLDPLTPSIVTFLSYTRPKSANEDENQNRPKQIPSFEILQREHARLSELLLRGLLELDGVEIPSGWAEARQARKEGVRKVQGELTKVDEAWGERKKLAA